MLHWIANQPYWLSLPIGILMSVATGLLIAELIHRVRSSAWQLGFKSLQPALLSPMMVAFSIFAVIIINTCWQNHREAERMARVESNAMKRLLFHLPPESQGRELLRRYIGSVLEHEWPAMAERHGHHPTSKALVELRNWVFAPDRPHRNTATEHFLIESMRHLSEAREYRLMLTRQTIPEILFAGLILCALLVLTGVAMVHAHNRHAGWLIGSLYGAAIGIFLMTITELYHPYSGSVVVSPAHIEDVWHRFDDPWLEARQ